MEKGQKVFGALYDWMLQEYQRQGVTKGKDLVLPVRTVWGWYMQEQGLQNGQQDMTVTLANKLLGAMGYELVAAQTQNGDCR